MRGFAVGTAVLLVSITSLPLWANAQEQTAAATSGGPQRSWTACLFRPDTGDCRAAFARFYFNMSTMACQEFIYGGCGGNGNNFSSQEECDQTCNAAFIRSQIGGQDAQINPDAISEPQPTAVLAPGSTTTGAASPAVPAAITPQPAAPAPAAPATAPGTAPGSAPSAPGPSSAPAAGAAPPASSSSSLNRSRWMFLLLNSFLAAGVCGLLMG